LHHFQLMISHFTKKAFAKIMNERVLTFKGIINSTIIKNIIKFFKVMMVTILLETARSITFEETLFIIFLEILSKKYHFCYLMVIIFIFF